MKFHDKQRDQKGNLTFILLLKLLLLLLEIYIL